MIKVLCCTLVVYTVCSTFTCSHVLIVASRIISKNCHNALFGAFIFACLSSCFLFACSKTSFVALLTWPTILSKSSSVSSCRFDTFTIFLILCCGIDFPLSRYFLFSPMCGIVFPLSFPFPSSSFPLDISLVSGAYTFGFCSSIFVGGIFQSVSKSSIMCPISSSINLYHVGNHSWFVSLFSCTHMWRHPALKHAIVLYLLTTCGGMHDILWILVWIVSFYI